MSTRKNAGFHQNHYLYKFAKNIVSYTRQFFIVLVFLPLLILNLSACSKQDNQGRDTIDVLRIGILPDENEETLLKRYTPFFEYISEKLNIPYALKIPDSYSELLFQFEQGNIDLAYFGGFTFIKAHRSAKAVPLVMRDIDINFTSYFISAPKSHLKKIKEFKGKSFSFGSNLSTSGHLMPRFYLKEQEISPESFFSKVVYSGSHDKTAYWVRDGIVDLGVSNSKVIDKMLLDGRLNHTDIHIIWETPPYPDYVWALQSDFSPAMQAKIRDIFLSLNPSDNFHALILSGMDTGGFLPASTEDFKVLEKTANEAGLLVD